MDNNKLKGTVKYLMFWGTPEVFKKRFHTDFKTFKIKMLAQKIF